MNWIILFVLHTTFADSITVSFNFELKTSCIPVLCKLSKFLSAFCMGNNVGRIWEQIRTTVNGFFSEPVQCMHRLDFQRSSVWKIVTEQPILWRNGRSNQVISCVTCVQSLLNCFTHFSLAISSRKFLSQPVLNPRFFSFTPRHCFKIAGHVKISNKNSEVPAQNLDYFASQNIARDPRITTHDPRCDG